jgi:hypothetical protein
MNKHLLILVFLPFLTFSQVGIGTTTPSSNSSLELAENNKGFLINRVTLTSTSVSNPLSAHVEGMLVYNTASVNDVLPGLYVNSGSSWERLIPSSLVKQRGIEKINTDNGTFSEVSSKFIFNSFTSGVPSVTGKTTIAPYGSSSSFITITPATNASDNDTFSCSKNIISLRVYAQIQSSSPVNSRWRTEVYLNGTQTFSSWAAPMTNVNNMRSQCVLEFGPIAANTSIDIRIDKNSLATSTQNQNTYIIVEYEL